MLSPEYLWDVADPVVDIWEELNIAMIIDICERLMDADLYDYHQLPGAARYEAWLANQYGMHYEEMVKVIAKLTKKSEAEVKRLFEEAGLLTLENDQMVYANRDIPPVNIRNNSALSQILREMYTRTNGELKNYTNTTLQNLPDGFYRTMDKAYVAVASGVETYSKAISDAVEELSKEGTQVTYSTGHRDKLDVAVRRAVLTGLNQGAAQISLRNAIDNGYEYVVVDAHLGARVNDKNKIANHAGWQGKIFKIDGKTKDYGNLKEETGFPGDPLGLCGYNCRHNFYPYMLGDPNPFEEDIPNEKENRKAYENSQKQRSMERKIRESKRNLMGLQTCIDNCQDDNARFDLQQEYNKKADRLQKQNKAYKEFCKKNGLKTEQERLKAAGWNRESANQARSGAKQYEKAKKSNLDIKDEVQSNMSDVTSKWYEEATPNSHEVVNLDRYQVGNNTYTVDGKSVILDPDAHEIEIANLLECTLGGEIGLVPRVLDPKNVSTPDYMFRGEPLDLKTITGSSKNVIYNALSKKRKQSNNFILDITNCPLDAGDIHRQIEGIYTSNHTGFVKRIMIVKNKKIVKIYERKKHI